MAIFCIFAASRPSLKFGTHSMIFKQHTPFFGSGLIIAETPTKGNSWHKFGEGGIMKAANS